MENLFGHDYRPAGAIQLEKLLGQGIVVLNALATDIQGGAGDGKIIRTGNFVIARLVGGAGGGLTHNLSFKRRALFLLSYDAV